MLGSMFENVFNRCFVLIKLNLFFWLMTVMGLVVTGVGPALMTINELFTEHQWDHTKMTFKSMIQLFKKNWKRGNQLFYLFFASGAIIGYNLFLAVQMQGIVFLVLDFFLIFAVMVVLLSYNYALALNSRFEMDFLDLIKLAFITFFANFFMVLKSLGGLALVLLLTYKFPGLILFATIALVQIVIVFVAKNWLELVEEKMVVLDGE